MALLDRHIAFVEALRTAGLQVSLAEDLDAVTAVTRLGLDDRETLRAGLAATLLKRQNHRSSFDAIFDLYFPSLLGAGHHQGQQATDATDPEATDPGNPDDAAAPDSSSQSTDERLAEMRASLTQSLLDDDQARTRQLAIDGVQQYGAMPGRARGLSSWSSYNTFQAVNPDTLVLRLARALMAGSDDQSPRSQDLAMLTATRRVGAWRAMVEGDVRRRIAEEKSPGEVARSTLRPTIDQLAFMNASRNEIDEMRRQIYPLARKLATRLAKEQHARRRGPLDFRRTVRASISTGGVPITTHHRPKRPHRTELVVLCDVSGSVANFASFTLLLVYALREQFAKVRAFTFVDEIHEVTDQFTLSADPEETLRRLAESARHASLWGRTNYGRAFARFQEQHADALTPKSSLLVLGDARSNFTDPGLGHLRSMAANARHSWWLNPEHTRQWDTGDSSASAYAAIVPMTQCRNLTQLAEFVHDIV